MSSKRYPEEFKIEAVDRVPGRGVRSNQEVTDSGMVGMSVRRSRRTG